MKPESQIPDEKLIALGKLFSEAAAKANKCADEEPLNRRGSQMAEARARKIGLQILRMRATSIAGLAVKAECLRFCASDTDDPPSGQFDDAESIKSLIRDLLAMQPTSTETSAKAA